MSHAAQAAVCNSEASQENVITSNLTYSPEGIELDEQKVFLGDDGKETYVGLVQRRKERGEKVTDTP